MAIRLIRLFTGDEDQSHFDVDEVKWNKTDALGAMSSSEAARTVSFEETAAGSSLDWHNAQHRRQYVITLSGRLEFETRAGKRQIVEPGDILLAEDTSGGDTAGASSTINRGAASTSPYGGQHFSRSAF